MQINIFLFDTFIKKGVKLVIFYLFICMFGLMPHVAFAFKGGTCTTTNKVNTWDSNTDWTCPGLGSGTISRLYDAGYRVVLVSSTTEAEKTEQSDRRVFRGREFGVPKILPILIIEQQPAALGEQKDYLCITLGLSMRCAVQR